jgi:16S rRNA (guanine527-N7)-methyltransferase
MSSSPRDEVAGVGDLQSRTALAGLAQCHGLERRQCEQLAALLAMLAQGRAPTAVRSPEQAVDVHLADSLAALELPEVRAARRIADVGTGAGFPGLPIAVALPGAEVSLIESQGRKCEFVERMCAAAEIENARVFCARAEEWGEGLGRQDVVMARAVAEQAVVLEYAAPLLRAGGAVVDWRGKRVSEEEDAAERAAEELGLRRMEVRRVEPFEGARDHHLHVYLKVRNTPERFPRRAGVARKRPLAS